jgi:glutaconyl-CoA/methylmalonyl-CoA decarboxylase subunit delta
MHLLNVFSSPDMKLGLIITLVGMGVVFVALMVLTIIFAQIPRFLKMQLRKKFRRQGIPAEQEDCCPDISGETNAAIAMAVFLFLDESHDAESHAMTIERVSRRYSPWSSKIYGLRNLNYPK